MKNDFGYEFAMKLGAIHALASVGGADLAVELWDPVPLGLVKAHGGPHALIATVITTRPTWSAGAKRGHRVKFSLPHR